MSSSTRSALNYTLRVKYTGLHTISPPTSLLETEGRHSSVSSDSRVAKVLEFIQPCFGTASEKDISPRRFQMNHSRAGALRVRILYRASALTRITRRWRLPVHVDEWDVQVGIDNKLVKQEYALNAGLYAFSAHTQGSSYWMAKFFFFFFLLATPLLTV